MLYSLSVTSVALSLFLGLDFFIGLPVSLFDRSATLALLENIDYKAALKELMKNSNPKYIQRKYADGSPTDMADVSSLH